MNNCELTYVARVPVNIERAKEQHVIYEQALTSIGVSITSLPALPELPDSVFVEDCAVVFDECAILTRPGAESRRPEVASIAISLAPFRTLHNIVEPAVVDGGDVLCVGKEVYVGLSSRTNQTAVEQMKAVLAPYGYSVTGLSLSGCLHLKTAVTKVKENTLLINPDWVDKSYFKDAEFIEVDPSEPFAANAILIEDKIIYSNSYPKTQKRLEDRGLQLVLVPTEEIAKAEGAVTCCSLIFKMD
jgi:dimethylargininase